MRTSPGPRMVVGQGRKAEDVCRGVSSMGRKKVMAMKRQRKGSATSSLCASGHSRCNWSWWI